MAKILAILVLYVTVVFGAAAAETVNPKVYSVVLLGQTGSGKSTLAETIARHLGYQGAAPAFKSSDEIHAHTQAPTSLVVKDVKITDTPGLMDTAGLEKDFRNMAMIVNSVSVHVISSLQTHSHF